MTASVRINCEILDDPELMSMPSATANYIIRLFLICQKEGGVSYPESLSSGPLFLTEKFFESHPTRSDWIVINKYFQKYFSEPVNTKFNPPCKN